MHRAPAPNLEPVRGLFSYVQTSAKKAGLGSESALCRIFVLVWGAYVALIVFSRTAADVVAAISGNQLSFIPKSILSSFLL